MVVLNMHIAVVDAHLMPALCTKIRERALTPEDYSAHAPYKFTPCPLPKVFLISQSSPSRSGYRCNMRPSYRSNLGDIPNPKKLELHCTQDADGYVHAFASDDDKGIQDFFQKYGVVVVRDVLTKTEIETRSVLMWFR